MDISANLQFTKRIDTKNHNNLKKKKVRKIALLWNITKVLLKLLPLLQVWDSKSTLVIEQTYEEAKQLQTASKQ